MKDYPQNHLTEDQLRFWRDQGYLLVREAADKVALSAINGLSEINNEKPGENFLQHYTIEHSRSGEGIISAWVALQELGVDGFQRYIAQMMAARFLIQDLISPTEFEVLNGSGLGFAVLVFPRLPFFDATYDNLIYAPESIVQCARRYCRQLFEYVSSQRRQEGNPIVGFISSYSREMDGALLPAIRLYPMSPMANLDHIRNILAMLSKCKVEFDQYFDVTMFAPEYEGLFPK